jgi:competence protein ComEC
MVDRAIVGPVSDASDTELRTALAENGAEVDEVARGAEGILGELRWRVLWPPARLGTIEPGNPASVTVRFEGVGACAEGCLSSIFLGDLGEDAQSRLLGLVHPEPVDIVKVAHHGSADQCERLYERLNARVGIIGVGTGNTYGHPTDELLNILNRVGTRITRTDLEGMILLSPAPGGGVLIWTERSPTRDVGAH